MNKALKISLKVLIWVILVVLILLFLVRIGERLLFGSFFINAKAEFGTPGISHGFVQQGFDYIQDKKIFLASGYMKEDELPSRIYAFDGSGVANYTELLNEKGEAYTGHCGGICSYGKYVYVANGGDDDAGIDVFLLEDILNNKITKTKMLGSIACSRASFCYIYGGNLYTGNFHMDDSKYLSPKEYIMTTPNKDRNTAILKVYPLDEKSPFGVNPNPKEAYSIPSKIQGMCITDDGKMIFSTSWGLTKSHLYIHDIAKARKSATTTDILGSEIPLYFFDSASLENDITAPPMAEELVYLNGRIFIMNESASAKYIFGKFTSGNHIYSYKYKDVE
ncbi:MAG: hypothetical protein J6K52_02830 [Clostridia bacterium]|nr:hypothetical protein [Clostridia bacterium]